ncbi:MAG: hypothetical protein IJ179_11555 [Oscillospiraceae bacterium]|nr:hypothetical protein [Oscillospiraceae bacterium]MBQ9250988.1 hypothetical protein [Oscillospiraceae bacterium]
MSNHKLRVLFTESDRALLAPVREALQAKGLRVSEATGSPGADDIVLVGLSEHFYADEAAVERLLGLLGAGTENVLPLQLDEAEMPGAIKNALYARNIIPAAQRDAALVAERILAALPQKKSRLPLVLSVAGVLLLAVVGLLIWRGSRAGGEAAPVMGDEPIVLPAGLTLEELEDIGSVAIVGDRFFYYTYTEFNNEIRPGWPGKDEFSYDTWEGSPHWYDREDGHEYRLTQYEDLRFLGLMRALKRLDLVLVDTDAALLPDLSGLTVLEDVYLSDCSISDLEWLRGARIMNYEQHRCPITDYSPLTDCTRLERVNLDLYGGEAADLSGFCPPALAWLTLENAGGLAGGGIASLGDCEKLIEVSLSYMPVQDLSFLDGCRHLKRLYLDNLDRLRDVSVLQSQGELTQLQIEYCDRLTDYAPIAGCESLISIMIHCDGNPTALRDASFLRGLSNLNDIHLYSCSLYNLDFLESFADRRDLKLGFAGDIGDYSGLAAVPHYAYLHVNPANGNYAAVEPYLENCVIDELMLYECRDVDLAALPQVNKTLSLVRGNLVDLTGLPALSIDRLQLDQQQHLTSLAGIENLTRLGRNGAGTLEIWDCVRLTDWSTIEEMSFDELSLTGQYTLPAFDSLHFHTLRLESIVDLEDLHFLDALDAGRSYRELQLVGLDQLRDLSPLWPLQINHLTVPPQLAEQAQELVDAGYIFDYRVEYPDSGWQADDSPVELLSLDELNTLPKALLKRVECVCIAGDQLVDLDRYEIWDDWEHQITDGRPGVLLYDRQTDEEIPVGTGSIEDLSLFENLTGLRDLTLAAQPLRSLDGVQALSQLEWLKVDHCYGLADASAAFALQDLQGLELRYTGISSIQGVQNLALLRQLNVSSTAISDLSPLAGCDFSAAYEENGIWLGLGDTRIEDFSPLAAIRRIDTLDVNGYDSAQWQDVVTDAEISLIFCRIDGDDALTALVQQHPELQELHFAYSDQVTDLTPLLSLENLRTIKISHSMEQALHSLDGQPYDFEIEIEG